MSVIFFEAIPSGDMECFCFNFTPEEYIKVFGQKKYDEEIKWRKNCHVEVQTEISDFKEEYPGKELPGYLKQYDGEFTPPEIMRVYPNDFMDFFNIDSSSEEVEKFTLIYRGKKRDNSLRFQLALIRMKYLGFGGNCPHGKITHEMNCRLYATDSQELGQKGGFCSCGLLHDLNRLTSYVSGVVERIYPDFDKEYLNSFYYPAEPVSKEEAKKFLESLGWTPVRTTKAEKEAYAKQVDDLIIEVFGQEYFNSLPPLKENEDD